MCEPALDTGFLIGTDDELVFREGIATPTSLVEVENGSCLGFEVRVAREHPATMGPGFNGVLTQPAPDGRLAKVIQLVAPLEERPIENYRARTAQIKADAIIIAGDFNVPARMQSLAPLRESLRDAWQVAGSGWGATVPEFLPLTRIDHVWVSESIEVVSVRVRRLAGSDHRAVPMGA